MVYTNDGKSYYIEDDKSMEELIKQYMGEDAADWFRETVCEAEYYRDKEYEEEDLEWEENRDMLVDIRDLADELIDMVDGRINKKTMRYKLQRIRDMVNDQL
jgi:hypothetical protein